MFAKAANSTPAVPSRNALRTLRHLALAGGTFGGFCAVAAITYDAHRRVRVAEKIVENKRTLRSSAPNYNARASAQRLAAMMEAAEAGEFMGIDSFEKRQSPKVDAELDAPEAHEPAISSSAQPAFEMRRPNNRIPPISPFKYRATNFNLHNTAQSQAATAWGTQNETAREEEELSTDERIQELLRQDKEIEATTLYMDLPPPPMGEFILPDRRELGCQLFAANCTKNNIYIARSLFERMEKWTYIDSELWGMMMHALAKEGHIESVGRIYDRYWDKLDVPVHLLEIVLRCLLESRRLRSAKWLFYNRLKHDENCGMCGAFLDGLWRKTHKSELVLKEFSAIMKDLTKMERKPTEKLFNPLLKSFIEAGKFEDAEMLVEEMPEKWGVLPGCRTLGLLVYGRALMSDWDGVMDGLREMHDLGFTQEKRNFAHVFDRVFLEYYPSHSGRQIYDFLIGCITEFELKPDYVLHKHILGALIERGDAEMLHEISRISETQEWKSGINGDDVVFLLKRRRACMQESPVGLWRMMQAARTQYGLVATTRRLMGTSADSYRLDREVLAPIKIDAEENYPVSVNNLTMKKSIDVYMPLHKRMEQAIHAGRFADAVTDLQNANHNGHMLKSVHFHLAVIAAILDDPRTGLPKARELIETEWTYWHKMPPVQYLSPNPRFTPIFFQQLLQIHRRLCTDVTLYKLALFEFYNVCLERPTLTVKNHASVSLARRLIAQHQPLTAIHVLRALYFSKWRKSHGFDQVQLKILMRAYAVIGNARGVWWCMLTVLSRHEPISKDFCAEVTRLMPGLKNRLPAKQGKDTLYPISDNILVLQEVADVLEKKASGDPYWSQFEADLEHKSKMRVQPTTRGTARHDTLPSAVPLETVITEFDEELEFERLERDPHFPGNRKRLRYLWDQRAAPLQFRTLPEHPEYPVEYRENPHRRLKGVNP